jgi:L-iditol 2-dehydrogenase
LLAAFVRKPEDGQGLYLDDVEVPNLLGGDVLLGLKASGICGTDIEKVRGKSITAPVLGHEVSGIIEASRSSFYSKGQRVIAHHHVACYSCEKCFEGNFTMCSRFKGSNFDPCGFAEFFRVPQHNVEHGGILRVPEQVSFEEACLVEPMACCYRALKKIRDIPGSTVVTVGVGSIGLLHLTLLRLFGARKIFAVDIVPERIDFATRKLGADGGFDAREDVKSALKSYGILEGPDIVVIASGAPGAIKNSLQLAKPGGTILLFGAPERGATMEVSFDSIFLSERKIVPSYSASEADMREVLDLIASGKVNLRSLIAETFPLTKTEQAFRRAQAIPGKVVVTN